MNSFISILFFFYRTQTIGNVTKIELMNAFTGKLSLAMISNNNWTVRNIYLENGIQC